MRIHHRTESSKHSGFRLVSSDQALDCTGPGTESFDPPTSWLTFNALVLLHCLHHNCHTSVSFSPAPTISAFSALIMKSSSTFVTPCGLFALLAQVILASPEIYQHQPAQLHIRQAQNAPAATQSPTPAAAAPGNANQGTNRVSAASVTPVVSGLTSVNTASSSYSPPFDSP